MCFICHLLNEFLSWSPSAAVTKFSYNGCPVEIYYLQTNGLGSHWPIMQILLYTACQFIHKSIQRILFFAV